MQKALLSLFYCVFSIQCFALTTVWEAPANNEIPLGSSSGVSQYVFGNPVDFPSAKQLVQIWLDTSDAHLYYAFYNGTSWSAPVNNQLPLGDSTSLFAFLQPVYDSASGQLIMVWQDNNRRLYYATYNGTSWTAPNNNQIPLGSASAVYAGAFNSPSIFANEMVIVWQESLFGPLFYATYDGTTWSTSSNNAIPLGTSTGSRLFLNPCYDTAANQLIQVWLDSTDPTIIYYSVYNGTNWSTATQVPTGSQPGVFPRNLLTPIYDSAAQQVVELWQNTNLYSAAYNAATGFVPANAGLPLGASTGVLDGGYSDLVYSSAAAQVLEVWQDAVNNSLYYASYNGTDWSAPNNNVLPLGSSSGVLQYSFLGPVYDNLTQQIVQIWQDSTNALYYYASYDGTKWSAPTNNQIPQGLSSTIDIYRGPVYTTSSGQLVLVWQDFSNNRIYYSVYQAIPPSPPASFGGKVIKNRFLSQTDRIYELAWKPSTDPSVIIYLLRRNGTLIQTSGVTGPFKYADHNRNKKAPYIYSLTTQDVQGLESPPLIVTFD